MDEPNWECPICHSSSWEWYEYIQLTGWRCATCEETIVVDEPE